MYVHRNNKKAIIGANKILEVIKLIHLPFVVTPIASLIHWDQGNLAAFLTYWLSLSLAEGDDISVASSVSNTCISACFTLTFSSRSKAVNFSQTGRENELHARVSQCQSPENQSIYLMN